MSKGAMKDLFRASVEDFNLMVKNLPDSEKPEVLRYFQERSEGMENLQ